MKMTQWVMTIAVLLGAGSTGSARAFDLEDPKELMRSCMSQVKNECQKWASAGGGSGNPKGLTRELAVELAMGERYMMFGTISIHRNEVFLEVDFNEHPWLKTRVRAKNPYYRIDTQDLTQWKKFNRKYVSFAAIARGAIFENEEGKRGFDIILEPTSAPQVNSLRSRE